MPDDIAIDYGNQRDRQGVSGPQGIDNQVFGLMAVGVVGECGDEDVSYWGVIVGDVSGRISTSLFLRTMISVLLAGNIQRGHY